MEGPLPRTGSTSNNPGSSSRVERNTNGPVSIEFSRQIVAPDPGVGTWGNDPGLFWPAPGAPWSMVCEALDIL